MRLNTAKIHNIIRLEVLDIVNKAVLELYTTSDKYIEIIEDIINVDINVRTLSDISYSIRDCEMTILMSSDVDAIAGTIKDIITRQQETVDGIISDLIDVLNNTNADIVKGVMSEIEDVVVRNIDRFKSFDMRRCDIIMIDRRLGFMMTSIYNSIISHRDFLSKYNINNIIEKVQIATTNNNLMCKNSYKRFRNDVVVDDDILEEDSPVISKIFEWKDMDRLAYDEGYIYKYSNGSHRIYNHGTNNRTLVIPTHTLGLGLSIKIQKDIYI